MNKSRQKKLRKYHDSLAVLLEKIQTELDAENEFYDNLSEKNQDGEKGEVSQNAINALEATVSDLESVMDNLSEAADALEEE